MSVTAALFNQMVCKSLFSAFLHVSWNANVHLAVSPTWIVLCVYTHLEPLADKPHSVQLVSVEFQWFVSSCC